MDPLYTAYLRAFLHEWGPWITVTGFAWAIYKTFRKQVTAWADKLLDNHLFHLQLSMDSLELKTEANLELQRRQIDLLERIADK